METPTPIVLKSDPSCRCCHGKGFVYESHGCGMMGGEQLLCDCVLELAPDTPEVDAALASGNYEIEGAGDEMPEDTEDRE